MVPSLLILGVCSVNLRGYLSSISQNFRFIVCQFALAIVHPRQPSRPKNHSLQHNIHHDDENKDWKWHTQNCCYSLKWHQSCHKDFLPKSTLNNLKVRYRDTVFTSMNSCLRPTYSWAHIIRCSDKCFATANLFPRAPSLTINRVVVANYYPLLECIAHI